MSRAVQQAAENLRAGLQLARRVDQAAAAPFAPPPRGRLGMERRRSRARAALNLGLMAASAVGLLWVAEGLLRFLGVH